MSTVETRPSKDDSGRSGGFVRRLFSGISSRISGAGLFIRQVVSELRKVVRPTRTELVTYTVAVFVFVLIIMTLVVGMDFGFGELMKWVFGGEAA